MNPAVVKLKCWGRALAISVALAGASVAAATAAPLNAAEEAEAQRLADSIVAAVMSSRAAAAAQPAELQRQSIERAMEDVIVASGATPVVAESALRLAGAALNARGVSTQCPPRSVQAEAYCAGDAAALAYTRVVAAVVAQVDSGVSAVQRLTGPAPLSPPPSLAGGGGTPIYAGAPR